MRKKIKNSLPVFFFLFGAAVVLVIGYQIYREPYDEAERRNNFEDRIIEGYLENEAEGNPDGEPAEDISAEYMYSDVDDYAFQGNLDCILVINKINLKKAIIRGNTLSDNEFNLSRYYFVTADLKATLDENYIISQHSCKQNKKETPHKSMRMCYNALTVSKYQSLIGNLESF